MAEILAASADALVLLFSWEPALWDIIGISFGVSLRAILVCAPVAIVVAFLLTIGRFPGRRALVSMFNSLMAVPAVVVGLTVYLLLSRSGPMGDLKLLFTQTAMIIGQMVLAFPLLVAMSHAALQGAEKSAWETAITLGANPWQAMLTVMREVRFGLIAAVIAGFARIIAEVGCSMMVGGNILGVTRNIPTAIALETSKGEFVQGIALGMVLLFLALFLNFVLSFMQGKGELT
ncbi:MAG: ABC transporter permease [Gammaproteobacteria bacterium]|nr:ABC transporter permease [Gammaproteobacteria bacterium]MDX2460080.1 ABC transporter permease [Gammaproteobacteria bacterium]